MNQMQQQNMVKDFDNQIDGIKKRQAEINEKKEKKAEKIRSGKKSTKTPSINRGYKPRKKR